MNKEQAQRIIKDTFEKKFEKSRFIQFIIELLNLKSLTVSDSTVVFNTNQIPNTYKPFINSFEKIADYKSGENKLDVLIIKLNRETSIERARTMQRNFIAWYLKGDCDGEPKDAALAAFVSPDEKDWRFSLIKMDYSLSEDKKGRVKISEEFTPAKRWSFLVGSNEKSHTAQSQLVSILAEDEKNPTLAQLEEAFNVERVTKEFFEKYRELFFWIKETLDEILSKDSKIKADFESKNINTVDFSKKLLGQIVFLYFLQKKGWFGVARDGDWGTGPKNFLRELFEGKHGKYNNFYNDILEPLFYEALRNDRSYDDDYYRLFNCKIPFLNGGLFDPIGNYDWVHTDINLPNELFSNQYKTKEGGIGTGILDVFDRYNFTVKEDEPLEKEVAVDPEMLGKVFENLLEVKDRKSKGTYYTPREIVHYMCEQSLINYLNTEMEGKVSKDDIEKLIKYGEQFGENGNDFTDSSKDISKSIIQNAKLIDEKLADIKVCDPAVGSGAFLVGMMGEIVRTRNVLSNYINDSNRTIYNLKRECIENSLYGVDIDSGAVEIAKLRLWLSLVVDEEDIKQIKPLPNLDYKIVYGNSLMSIEKNLFNHELFNQLESLKKLYFDEINPNKKQELKDQINKLINEISNGKEDFDFEIYFSEVFQRKGGFDVVIANPPYGIKLIKDNKTSLEIKFIEWLSSNKNSAIYFIYLADSISQKKGVNSFIVPKSLCYSLGWNNCARFLINDLKNLIDGGKAFQFVKLEQVIFIKQKLTDQKFYITGQYNNSGIQEFEKINKDVFNDHKVLISGIRYCEIKLIKKIINSFYKKWGDYVSIERGLNWQSKVKKFPGNTPIYRGSQLRPYFINKATDFIDITKFNRNEYEYLLKPKILNQLAIAHVQNPYPHFYLQAALDTNNKLVFETISCTFLKNTNVNIKFLLAINNSKLFAWLLYKFIYCNAVRSTRYDKQYIEKIPVPDFDNINQDKYVKLVDEILSIIGDNFYNTNKVFLQIEIQKYMKQIDQFVYELYNLNDEEIKIVEGK
ncbi:MAG: BREX-1 system adenine-specific DNA-methyltransferase PglX [Actinobacteria bacterium]|nr:BREX-1 system adenine-specific DNA-methyltransferase PglX [Cyanobacteriota bacterium]MCL6087248.1 BREX-1 system adenine-specific DNA-methyltransferase PglX [Actinomycetota bacterium]